jgi:hypothetical protein
MERMILDLSSTLDTLPKSLSAVICATSQKVLFPALNNIRGRLRPTIEYVG